MRSDRTRTRLTLAPSTASHSASKATGMTCLSSQSIEPSHSASTRRSHTLLPYGVPGEMNTLGGTASQAAVTGESSTCGRKSWSRRRDRVCPGQTYLRRAAWLRFAVGSRRITEAEHLFDEQLVQTER